MRFEFTGGEVKSVKDKIDKKFQRVERSIKKSLKDYYGDSFIRDKMFDGGDVFSSASRGAGRDKLAIAGAAPEYRRVAEIYQKAFAEHYKKVQAKHESHANANPRSKQHLEAKMGGKKAPHANVEYPKYNKPASYSIWSGMFMNNIMDAFDRGGNKFLHIANMLIDSSIDLQKGSWDNAYFGDLGGGKQNIHETMVDIANLSGRAVEDAVPLEKNTANRAKKEMMSALRNGFIDPVGEILSNMEIEI